MNFWAIILEVISSKKEVLFVWKTHPKFAVKKTLRITETK
jgi:hypothetical protein